MGIPKYSPIKCGDVFGRWVVLSFAGRPQRSRERWLCRCSCGTTKSVKGDSLKRRTSVSCGCYFRERRAAKAKTHGLSQSKTYLSWVGMRNRCLRKNAVGYKDYGGRGIRVCAAWRNSFAAFLADMGEKPPGTSLDRIDNNGNYEPKNCRWATPSEQARNSRRTRMVTYAGESLSAIEWAERTNVCYQTFIGWLNRYGTEKAFECAKNYRPICA